MAKQQVEIEEKQPVAAEKPPVQTQEQLLALLTKIVSNQASDDKFEKLAAAIIESRKPYVDPMQQENLERQREQERQQRKRNLEAKKQEQKVCPHVQGALGENPSLNKSSFVLHRLDTGVEIGICTACQKVICSLNEEDRVLFARARGGNRMSAGGVRTFMDQNKAMRDGWRDYES